MVRHSPENITELTHGPSATLFSAPVIIINDELYKWFYSRVQPALRKCHTVVVPHKTYSIVVAKEQFPTAARTSIYFIIHQPAKNQSSIGDIRLPDCCLH